MLPAYAGAFQAARHAIEYLRASHVLAEAQSKLALVETDNSRLAQQLQLATAEVDALKASRAETERHLHQQVQAVDASKTEAVQVRREMQQILAQLHEVTVLSERQDDLNKRQAEQLSAVSADRSRLERALAEANAAAEAAANERLRLEQELGQIKSQQQLLQSDKAVLDQNRAALQRELGQTKDSLEAERRAHDGTRQLAAQAKAELVQAQKAALVQPVRAC